MEHIDFVGIATLITALAAAIVSVITAIQGRNNQMSIQEVHRAVDGQADKRAAEAFKSGVLTAAAVLPRREQDPNVPPEHRPAV